MGEIPDPFGEARRDRGVLGLPTDREVIPLILRHEEVRKAAKDWQTFSSDAPFRVPIPSEGALRSVRPGEEPAPVAGYIRMAKRSLLTTESRGAAMRALGMIRFAAGAAIRLAASAAAAADPGVRSERSPEFVVQAVTEA